MAAARLDGSLANAQRCSQTPAAAACKTLWAARGTALEPCPLTCVLRRKAAIGTELPRCAFAQVCCRSGFCWSQPAQSLARATEDTCGSADCQRGGSTRWEDGDAEAKFRKRAGIRTKWLTQETRCS